jgi:patatin-like phospholipase/acyl hydrolase
MSTYNVLSLDGGGCRGVVSAVLVAALAERAPCLLDRVHLFAGTSIGAANALAYASGRHPDKMVEFYATHGKELFSKRMRPRGMLGLLVAMLQPLPLIGSWVNDLDSLFLPKWSNKGLRGALADYFGEEEKLADLAPKRVLLTALALEGTLGESSARVVVPVPIDNFESSGLRDLPIHEAALRSMSAPTFFESVDGYVDGGVFANNPSIAALAAAIDHAGRRLEDVRLLSIGTGICSDAVRTRGSLRWGALQWGLNYAELSLRAVSEFDHLQSRAILREERYHRLDVTLPRNIPMDDIREIPALEAFARDATRTPAFEDAVRFVEKHFA